MRRKFIAPLMLLAIIAIACSALTLGASAAAISPNSWAIDYADFCINMKMMGVSRSSFNPDSALTRSELAVAFMKAENESMTNKVDAGYSDVRVGYSNCGAIFWVTNKGIMTGYDDGTFKPGKAVTREELCVAVVRYEEMICNRTLNETATLPFSDADSIPKWSLPSIKKLYNAGIVNGLDDGTFSPKIEIKRNQAATMLTKAYGYGKNSTGGVYVFVKKL